MTQFTKDQRFSSLRSINISQEKLTTVSSQDLNTLFQFIRQNKCLQRIGFVNVDLSCIPGYHLSNSLLHIPSLVLDNCKLTTEQLTCLLRELKFFSPLTLLSLTGNSLEFVPPELFVTLSEECERLNLSLTDLNTEQLTCLLINIHCESKLKSLNLSDLDLSQIDAVLMRNPTKYLQSMYLSNVIISEEAKQSLFDCLSIEEVFCQILDLAGVNVSDIDSVMLALAVCKIEEVHLANSWLSATQFESILERLSETTQIKRLDVCGNSNLDSTTAEDILLSSMYLEYLNMASCSISQETLTEFIQVQNSDEKCTFILGLFEGDYTTAHFKNKLRNSKCIELSTADIPVYSGEQSCGYSEDKSEPITLTETIRFER